MIFVAMAVVCLKMQPMSCCVVPLLLKVELNFEKCVVHADCNLIFERFLRVKNFILELRNCSPLLCHLIMLQMIDFYVDFNLSLDLFMSNFI